MESIAIKEAKIPIRALELSAHVSTAAASRNREAIAATSTSSKKNYSPKRRSVFRKKRNKINSSNILELTISDNYSNSNILEFICYKCVSQRTFKKVEQ